MRCARTAAAAVAFALAAALSPTTAHAATDFGLVGLHPGQTVTVPVRNALVQLPVAGEDRAGYQRTAFKHWVDADKDGCTTRAEVLQAEAVVAPEQGRGASCPAAGGTPPTTTATSADRGAWTSTTWSRWLRHGTLGPRSGLPPNARRTRTTWATSGR